MPMSCIYTISFSLVSQNQENDGNNSGVSLHLYHNSVQKEETFYYGMHDAPLGAQGSSNAVYSTGGREVFIQAVAGDTLSFKSDSVDLYLGFLISCFEYNSV